jgi:hypothetical protein
VTYTAQLKKNYTKLIEFQDIRSESLAPVPIVPGQRKNGMGLAIMEPITSACAWVTVGRALGIGCLPKSSVGRGHATFALSRRVAERAGKRFFGWSRMVMELTRKSSRIQMRPIEPGEIIQEYPMR